MFFVNFFCYIIVLVFGALNNLNLRPAGSLHWTALMQKTENKEKKEFVALLLDTLTLIIPKDIKISS